VRLGISNIAWDIDNDEAIAGLLHGFAIDAIDVVPGKYFLDPAQATDKDIARVRAWWFERGIEIIGMQALFFGTTGLNVFGSKETQERMLQHVSAVCRVATGLCANRLVFGSPKNRDRSGLSDQQAKDVAIPFFQRVGDIAQQHGVVVCLEPNPPCYGANFLTSSAETAILLEQIDHPALRMQLDTGALVINSEDIATVLQRHAHLIGHVHASEPNLLPLGDGDINHAYMAKSLKKVLPQHLVTIEMLATTSEPATESITRALRHATAVYRPT
jgi:D-psicose/D-tagatose/L-ribulose 3-epimerase